MMRLFLSFLLITLLSFQSLNAQSNAEKLKSIVQTPDIAGFFEGLFQTLGVVMDNGEEFTIIHEGTSLRIENGLDKSKVDYVLPLIAKDIGNITGFSEDGKIDEVEATHIAKVFFTPFTRETLKSPLLSNEKKRKKAGIEDLTHVYLVLPDGNIMDEHSLIFANDQWIVLNELVGTPARTYRLTAMEALKYQRKIMYAMKVNTKKDWIAFAKWHKAWKQTVSTTPSKQ